MTAAADKTAGLYRSNTQGIMPIQLYVLKVTQSDWINLSNIRGIWLPSGFTVTAAANVVETPTYGTAAINNSGTAYSTTDTSIVVQTAQATRKPPYYILTAGGEVMLCVADSTPTATTSTLTVQRGMLGTTASATGLANTNVVSILNQIVLGSASVGPTFLRAVPFTGEPDSATVFSVVSP